MDSIEDNAVPWGCRVGLLLISVDYDYQSSECNVFDFDALLYLLEC